MKWIVNPISINPITPQECSVDKSCLMYEIGGMPPCELDGPPGGGGGHCHIIYTE